MIAGFLELSQESPNLAEAEAICGAEALGGGCASGGVQIPGLVAIEVPDIGSMSALARRLALARRGLVIVSASGESLPASAEREGASGASARFRRVGRPTGGEVDEAILRCGRAFKAGGGTIDLAQPARRFWLARSADGQEHLLEEVGEVDREGLAQRRMPLLPFRRPVSLPPRLARAAVNLARVAAGDRVLDPFLGTGALLAEAGLLGGKLFGIDRDSAMVQGALRNLSYLGVAAEELVVGDAREANFSDPSASFAAVVTDTPYGRSSSTGGEGTTELVSRVVERWWDHLTPDGTLVVVAPATGGELDLGGPPRFRIPVRVHRSLTREFCMYDRSVER